MPEPVLRRTLYRFLQVLAGVNVVLASVMIFVEVAGEALAMRIAHSAFYGLGFLAMGVSATLELRRPKAGRWWMVIGGLSLLAGSVVYFLARSSG